MNSYSGSKMDKGGAVPAIGRGVGWEGEGRDGGFLLQSSRDRLLLVGVHEMQGISRRRVGGGGGGLQELGVEWA